MGFCKSDQKSIPVVGFLTHNDCDVLRAKTGVYRQVTHRTIILPTMATPSPGDLVITVYSYPSHIHNSPSTITHPTKTPTQPTLDCMPLGLTVGGRKHQQVGRCSCALVDWK